MLKAGSPDPGDGCQAPGAKRLAVLLALEAALLELDSTHKPRTRPPDAGTHDPDLQLQVWGFCAGNGCQSCITYEIVSPLVELVSAVVKKYIGK